MQMKQVIKECLDAKKGSVKTKTLSLYKLLANNHFGNIENVEVKHINADMLKLFEQSLHLKKNSYSTLKIIIYILNQSLIYAFENGYTQELFTVKLKMKASIKNVNALTIGEQNLLETFISKKKKSYYYGILISLYTGIRIGELLALTWKDVDLKHKLLYINKTVAQVNIENKLVTIESSPKTESSVRVIPLSVKACQMLRIMKSEQKNKSPFVVSRVSGKQVFVRAYQRGFKMVQEKAHIKDYGFHSLRHTFATRAIEKGVDVKTLSELLGHSSVSTTLGRYVHSSIKQKRIAINKIFK